MRNLHELDRWRIADGSDLNGRNDPAISRVSGTFLFELYKEGPAIVVVASNGDGWDHVSVSLRNRTPSWAEMDAIKRLFFKPDEVAMQIHPAVDDHISVHPHCLHLWRPHGTKRAIPLPPKEFV